MHGELAAVHFEAVGELEGAQRGPIRREQYVGVVVFFERALDHLAVLAEQVVYLTLSARVGKVGHVQLGGYVLVLRQLLLLLLAEAVAVAAGAGVGGGRTALAHCRLCCCSCVRGGCCCCCCCCLSRSRRRSIRD